jgi:hypothetical protein
VIGSNWRSVEQLNAYAKNRDRAHLPGWAAFNREGDERDSCIGSKGIGGGENGPGVVLLRKVGRPNFEGPGYVN